MQKSLLTIFAVLFAIQSAATLGAPPEEVKKYLKSRVGRWEVKGGIEPNGVGRHTSVLVAGGTVLLSRGTVATGQKFVHVYAWESDKKKLVLTHYGDDGSIVRREESLMGNTVSGTVKGVDADGKPFSGTFTETMKGPDGGESSYKGTYQGKKVELKWTIRRLPELKRESKKK